jgi:hypothetical protein
MCIKKKIRNNFNNQKEKFNVIDKRFKHIKIL